MFANRGVKHAVRLQQGALRDLRGGVEAGLRTAPLSKRNGPVERHDGRRHDPGEFCIGGAGCPGRRAQPTGGSPTNMGLSAPAEDELIAFTGAFGAGWEPSAEPSFTAIATFRALPGGRTRNTVRARHWTLANRKKHEKMGFHHGWGESLDRLVSIVTRA
jgi:hypothetical protein